VCMHALMSSHMAQLAGAAAGDMDRALNASSCTWWACTMSPPSAKALVKTHAHCSYRC
jgi:hypothetical protein